MAKPNCFVKRGCARCEFIVIRALCRAWRDESEGGHGVLGDGSEDLKSWNSPNGCFARVVRNGD